MAVAPALPWRRASGELLWDRLRWPTWFGVATLVFAVAVGARGIAPLLAFGLGGFAAAAAVRQLSVSVAAARRDGASVLRAFVGRSNGGMIVHVGVVVVAVAFTAASSYTTSATFTLTEGSSASIAGHTVTYEGMNPPDVDPRRTVLSARIRVDGGRIYEPALNEFPRATQTIGTPSVRVGAVEDVYLTLVAALLALGRWRHHGVRDAAGGVAGEETASGGSAGVARTGPAGRGARPGADRRR
jgi:cytochrome c-type biogenesis protein CcmF